MLSRQFLERLLDLVQVGNKLSVVVDHSNSLCNSGTFLGLGIFAIALFDSGSADMPLEFMMSPKYLISFRPMLHFSGRSLQPLLSKRRRVPRSRWSCSSLVEPAVTTSSKYAFTPSSPESVRSIACWKIAGAVFMPKGKPLKRKRPFGVVIVVTSRVTQRSQSGKKRH